MWLFNNLTYNQSPQNCKEQGVCCLVLLPLGNPAPFLEHSQAFLVPGILEGTWRRSSSKICVQSEDKSGNVGNGHLQELTLPGFPQLRRKAEKPQFFSKFTPGSCKAPEHVKMEEKSGASLAPSRATSCG